MAERLGKGFIPIRKKGKLPPPVISESYTLEYGEDSLEISTLYNKQKVVIVDMFRSMKSSFSILIMPQTSPVALFFRLQISMPSLFRSFWCF